MEKVKVSNERKSIVPQSFPFNQYFLVEDEPLQTWRNVISKFQRQAPVILYIYLGSLGFKTIIDTILFVVLLTKEPRQEDILPTSMNLQL
jgi:hypothetical protein